MKIVHISDTHRSRFDDVPKGDVLVHTGDYSLLSKHSTLPQQLEELREFNFFLDNVKKKFSKILFVPGNHDLIFEQQEQIARGVLTSATVLIDESIEIDGKVFYGTPSQPKFCNWAFNHNANERIKKFNQIPDNVNVLLTHCPAYKMLDLVNNTYSNDGHVGCKVLANRINELKSLELHCCGHIHEAYGIEEKNGVTFSNASLLDAYYKQANQAIEIELKG